MKPDDQKAVLMNGRKGNQEQTVDIRDSRLASSPVGFSDTNSNSNELKPSDTRRNEDFEVALSPISEKIENDALDHTILNNFLTFRNPDLEREFFYYITALNLARWRRTLSGLFIAMSILYIYLITRNSVEWVQWKGNFAPELKTGPLTCPAGFFCSECNPGMICNEYDPLIDAVFWLTTVFIPYSATLIFKYFMQPKKFMNMLDTITVSLVFSFVFLGIGLRYFIIENMRNFFQPTLLMMSLLLVSCIGMRPRFLYAVILMSLVSGSWIIMNSISLIINVSRGEAAAYSLGFLGMLIISCATSFIGYETEHFYRFQFMTSKEMKKNNAKLTNQLNMLVKTYNAQAGKMLESPLERGMLVIRSVMADPTLSSRHLLALGQVTALLASSNLLIPDFENTTSENMDNEQQAWLFSEIAARKRNKTKANATAKRRSGFPADGVKRFLNSSIPDESFLNTKNSDESHVITNGIKVSRSTEDSRAVYPPTIEEISTLLTRCDDYNFNLFHLADLTGNRSLFVFSHHLFYESRLFEGFGIPIDKFANFIRTIEKGYRAELPCNY